MQVAVKNSAVTGEMALKLPPSDEEILHCLGTQKKDKDKDVGEKLYPKSGIPNGMSNKQRSWCREVGIGCSRHLGRQTSLDLSEPSWLCFWGVPSWARQWQACLYLSPWILARSVTLQRESSWETVALLWIPLTAVLWKKGSNEIHSFSFQQLLLLYDALKEAWWLVFIHIPVMLKD